MHVVRARLLGTRAAVLVNSAPLAGRVLACFDHACNLLTGQGALYALVWNGPPVGPFSILLDSKPGAPLPAGAPFAVASNILSAGPWHVDLSSAGTYDPQPDWPALAAQRAMITARLPRLTQLLAAEAPPASLAHLDQPAELVSLHEDSRAVTRATARRAISDILQGAGAVDRGVAALCGLGPGLTPAGDDWLAGWLLALRLYEGNRTGRLAAAQAAARRALPATTTLSRAFLECALAGEVDADWHALLRALAFGSQGEVVAGARAVLHHGATSGADMLAGFVAGLRPRPFAAIAAGAAWASAGREQAWSF